MRKPGPTRRDPSSSPRDGAVRHGIARALSRAGLCSRSEAAARVRAGRVEVDGRVVLDPEHPTTARSRIRVDGLPLAGAEKIYLMLNKPRGLVTTVADERGRDTVYRCFDGAGLPWIAPVGRLDQASEGLLLFSNDPAWAARITDPASGPGKTYHVQVDGLPDAAQLAAMIRGVEDAGEPLAARSARVLRHGERSAWLEIALDEGRNRHIRRMLAALGFDVRRLLRVAIGDLALGDLPKGQWRALSLQERDALAPAAPPPPAAGAPTARR